MYYRVAIQVEEAPAWKWKSSVLGSFNILLDWLQHFRVLPAGRLRIFSSTLVDALRVPQVPAEDQALWATSVLLPQFLLERGLARAHEASTAAAGSPGETAAAAGVTHLGVAVGASAAR
jgi:hypothetical protein